MPNVTVTFPNGETRQVEIATPLQHILPDQINDLPVLAAIIDNDIRPLDTPVVMSFNVRPITLADPEGWLVYRNTLCFILAAALHQIYPTMNYRVRNSFGTNALYWTADFPNGNENDLPHFVSRLNNAMQRLIEDDLPITHHFISYTDAIETFSQNNQLEKVALLKHRNPPYIHLRYCGDFYDLPQGMLATHTGVLKTFSLLPHHNGFILQFPDFKDPKHLQELPPYNHLSAIYQEHASWGEILHIRNAGELNDAIDNNEINDVINTVEALHEKKLSSIADAIATRTPRRPHVVLIAGPSSAGKTTVAMRLCTHLRVLGLHPTLISTDNYFRGEGQNPLDESGKPDFEHIDAMDCPRLNADILKLLKGDTIPLRRYDFAKRRGYDSDQTLQINSEDGILVIEGIHSLNPDLTPQIPREEKFLVYVSALTQLAIDRNNRISTIDNRLLRRLVRDHLFRGKRPIDTLRLWPSVRRGEERWIFPYQHLADAVFNSSLDYEIPVLKTLVTPLLNTIKPNQPEYLQVRLISGFLRNFRSMPFVKIPTNSILCEYLGASRLDY